MELNISGPERDALIAAIRLLQREMEAGRVAADDGDIGEILTNSGEHRGLSVNALDLLCNRVNC